MSIELKCGDCGSQITRVYTPLRINKDVEIHIGPCEKCGGETLAVLAAALEQINARSPELAKAYLVALPEGNRVALAALKAYRENEALAGGKA